MWRDKLYLLCMLQESSVANDSMRAYKLMACRVVCLTIILSTSNSACRTNFQGRKLIDIPRRSLIIKSQEGKMMQTFSDRHLLVIIC